MYFLINFKSWRMLQGQQASPDITKMRIPGTNEPVSKLPLYSITYSWSPACHLQPIISPG